MKKFKLLSLLVALSCAMLFSVEIFAAPPGGGGGGVTPPTPTPTPIEEEPPHTNPTSVEGSFSYTGSPQTLFNEGTTHESTVMYYRVTMTNTKPTTDPKTTPGDWSTSIAQQTNAGSYYLWFYIDGRDSYIDVHVNDNPITNEIQKAPSSVSTAPTANPNTIKYDGYSKQVFWSAGSTSDGTMYYQVTTTNTQPGKSEGTWTSTWNSSITHRINAGTYYLWYYVEGDENHLATEVLGPVTKELQKGTRSYTKPSVNGGATTSWTGSAQTLFNAGSGTGTATLMYLVNESNTKPSKSDEGWGTTIPQKTDIGTYRLWYYLDGGANYEDTEINSTPLSKNIVKAYPSVTAPVAKTIPYDGESHELITAGSTSLFTMEYKVGDGDWSSSIPSATAIGDYTVSYRVVPDDPDHYNQYGPYNVSAHIKAPVASITTSASVTTLYTEFNDAVSAWVDGSTLKLLKAAETGSWYSLEGKGSITLDLNGFGIRSTSSQSYPLFRLKENYSSVGTSLTIIDSNPTATHKFSYDDYNHHATLDEEDGDIIISGGYITNCQSGVIQVYDQESSLTMNAGTIIGNYNNGAISLNAGDSYTPGGTFTMNAGAICYNHSENSGVGVNMGGYTTFTMNGGSITYNVSTGGQGTGVSTNAGVTFTIDYAPEIRYNSMNYQNQTDNVYIYGSYFNNYEDDYIRIQIGANLDRTKTGMIGVNTNVNSGYSHPPFTDGLDNYIDYFFADRAYNPIRTRYEDSEGEFYYNKATLDISGPEGSTAVTYDGNSHAMLSTPATANGPATIKYAYRFRRHNVNSWSGISYSDWSTSLPYGTEAGRYDIKAKAFATDQTNYYDSGESTVITFTINKAPNEFTVHPTAKGGLVYNGSPQELVNAGAVAHGQMQYSIAGVVNLHPEIPTATEAGTYRVNYFMDGGDNYVSDFSQSWWVNVTIYPLSVSELDNDIDDFFDDWIGQTVPLRIERTLLKNGYFNTLCLPFDLSASEIAASELAGCELFVFAEAEMETNEETGEPQLRQVITPATSIQAGVPYLIRWKNSGPTITELVFSEVTIQDAMGDGVDPSAISTEGVQFLGFVPRTHIDYVATNHNYLFLGQNNTLVWPASDDNGTMKGFRAYFYIPSGTTINNAPVYHGMPARLVIREKAPTGVEEVTGYELPVTEKVMKDGILYIIKNGVKYNAQGQVVK